MAMVELASRAEAGNAPRGLGRPVSLAEIADAQALSLAYLEQLFALLRRSGLVASVRGPGGGYRLGRPAREITLADITDAVEETIRATRCDEGGPGCIAGQRCLTHDLWAELGEQIRLFLAHVKLADVVEGRVLGRAAVPGLGVSFEALEEHPAEGAGGGL
ncbi:MAG: Iron-sulfur cluster regulator IscR [uncultured Acetobacteraceae bacterium]|uniref:Iron-sulfur cluster regulator IscR n=1 Tax=uncultured Acetobacteraceae bacterium TaxID=169975 RepID=A0A6J4JVZ2_9PROT|nr:MAG: Iron-sulfur cluster regulator IscR [uncultured Acetobacteraceae bacterium]